jgi:hypothetical protein
VTRTVYLDLERARAQRISNNLNDRISQSKLIEYIAEIKAEQSKLHRDNYINHIDI